MTKDKRRPRNYNATKKSRNQRKKEGKQEQQQPTTLDRKMQNLNMGDENEGENRRKMTSNCPHPLLISDILGQIFPLLPDEDLVSCRVVCKLWCGFADEEKNKRHAIVLRSDNEVKEVVRKIKNTERRFHITQLQLFEINLEHPNSKLLIAETISKLSFLSLVGCTVNSLESFYELIRLVCPLLRKMDLGCVKYPSGRYIRYFPIPMKGKENEKMIFYNMRHFEYISFNDHRIESTPLSSVCKTFPNLTQLVINNMCEEDLLGMKGIVLPHLKKLSVRMMPHEDKPSVINTCSCCAQERAAGMVPYTDRQILQGEGGIKDIHIKILMSLKLQLEELELWNINRRVNSDLLREFVQQSSATLQRLELIQEDLEGGPDSKCKLPAPSPFPALLPVLSTLVIQRPFIRNLNHVFSSCPELETVQFDFYENANWNAILPGRIQSPPKLKILILKGLDVNTAKKLLPMMDGSELKLCLNDATDALLEVLFSKFARIKHLHIEGESLTTKGVLGLTAEEIAFVEDENETKVDELRGNRLYLGNLKALESLTLECLKPEILIPFVKYGLRDCASLYLLVIRGSTETMDEWLSEEFVALMEEEDFIYLDDCKWNLDNEKGFTAATFVERDHLMENHYKKEKQDVGDSSCSWEDEGSESSENDQNQ